MDRNKAIEAGIAIGSVALGAGLYYEYRKGIKFPITNPKPIYATGANVSQGGTAQVYEQVNYPTSETVKPAHTPTTTVTPQPPPVKPTGTSTSQVTSGQIIECPENTGTVKTEYGLVPCTPGYKYYDLKGALFEYEFYSIVQQAMETNQWGVIPDVDLLQEAYDYLVSKNRDVTTATICYSVVPLGMFSKVSFQPNAMEDAGDNSKPYLPGISACKGDNNTFYQLASSHVRANYFYSQPNYFASMTVYGPTITTDPYINFPNVKPYDCVIITSDQITEPTLFIAKYTSPFTVRNCEICPPTYHYLNRPYVPILAIPYNGSAVYFIDNFRGIPSLSTQPPIQLEWTKVNYVPYVKPNPPIHVSYEFVDAEMYYRAKYTGQPIQPGKVSYDVLYYVLPPPCGFKPTPPPYTGDSYDETEHFNGYAIWWD